MAMLPKVFNTSNVEDESSTLPEGWYTAQIVKSEVKDTAAKDGKYISLHFKIVEGDHAKRMVFENLNIINKNPTTVKIAEQALKKICDALGIEEFEDTTELHDQDIQIMVKTQAASSNYPAKDVIKNYKAAE